MIFLRFSYHKPTAVQEKRCYQLLRVHNKEGWAKYSTRECALLENCTFRLTSRPLLELRFGVLLFIYSFPAQFLCMVSTPHTNTGKLKQICV